MSQYGTLPVYVNPALRPGLDALSWWLGDQHYSAHAIGRILAHTAAEGTPTGSPYLEREDEAGATEAFIDALPAVPLESPAWDDESVILDARLLAEDRHPFPCDPTEAELIFHEAPDGPAIAAKMLARGVPPVSGGSAEAEPPFEPSPEDAAWWAAQAARAEPADRHSPEALARTHRALYGRSEPFHA